MVAGSYTLLGAWNDPSEYEDALYALLQKGTDLFEYEDSHCSCNEFEFNPQPVTLEYILKRPVPDHAGVKEDEWNLLVASLIPDKARA